MKKMIHKFTALLLTFIMLIASTGVSVASHVCLSSKHKSVSLFKVKGCCAKETKKCDGENNHQNSFSKNCCIVSFSYFKSDVTSVQNSASVKIFSENAPVEILPFMHQSFSNNFSLSVVQSYHPPSVTGKALVIRQHSFLI